MPAGDLEIATDRMRLAAASEALLHAALHAPGSLSAMLDAVVPAGWPPPDNVRFLQSMLDAVRGDRTSLGWGPWLMLLREPAVLVGDAGFKRKPDAGGVV